MDGTDQPQLLIVDDDPQVRDLYAGILEDTYDVLTADSGERALELIDEDVNGVLLDRRMNGLSGKDVLARMRESGYEMPVAMVTAVDPDFDVLQMGFDDYVVKPIRPEELRELAASLVVRREYETVIQEYFALVSKVTALQQAKPPETLDTNDEYLRSEERLQEIKRQAHVALDAAIEAGEFDKLFKEFATKRLDDELESGPESEVSTPN